MREMGERLMWVREVSGDPSSSRKVSQEKMASLIGVHQTAWGLYESGKRWPDQFELVRLLAKLKITREYLLYGCLDGVERTLAIRLAAAHPELVAPKSKALRTGTDPI